MFRLARYRSVRVAFAILAGSAAFTGCSEPTSAPPPASIILVSVRDTVEVGGTTQLGANVLSASGSALSGVALQWTSSNLAVATVSSSGNVTGVSAGTAIITANASGITQTRSIVVRAPICAAPSNAALVLGSTRSGNTATGPCRLFGLETAIGYPLSMPSAGGLSLSLTSTGFAGRIAITSTDGQFLVGSPMGGLNARLRTTLPAGNYRVYVVSDFAANPGHTFTLTASAAGGRCEDGTVSRSLALGVVSDAAVNELSCILLSGPAVEGWRLVLTAPAVLRFTATSAAFPPIVAVTPADYSTVIIYDIADLAGSVAVSASLPAGEYLVWGGSFDFLNGTVQVAAEVVPPCVASGTLGLPASVNGALQATDCPSLRGSSAYADVWTFTISDSTTVRFDLTSAAYDTYLELRDANDLFIAGDDDSGEGLNSQISIRLGPGSYRLWATSFSGMVTGAYTLSSATATATASALRAETVPDKPISSARAARERGAWLRP